MADYLRERQRTIQWVILACSLALLVKAAQIQLLDDSFKRRADATTVEKMTIYPPRGLVFDRNGDLIVNNNAMYDLMVTFNQIDPEMDTLKLCRLLDITKADFEQLLDKPWSTGKYSRSVPFVFMKKLSTVTYARLQECLYQFPGFFVQVRNIRGYPHAVGAHLLGYINEVDPRDIEKGGGVYVSGDYIGASGMESEYENRLRGEKGYAFLLKDNLGRIVGEFENGNFDTLPASGDDLISSIDVRLQAYGEQLMQNKTGSVVAIEPETGEILAMVSTPTYDPNDLTMTQDRGPVFSRLLTDPLKPFFDRTVMAKYPPGSIFKTVVTLIGLQEGTLNPNAGVSCNGGYFYAGRLYKCHHHSHVGNVVDALAYSCNTFYFSEFRDAVDKFGFSNPQAGLDMFVKYCHQLGLGRQLGVDYPNESAGNIPDSKYYDRIYPRKLGGWRSPTIMSVGIGQGELQLTTLQMANLAACIANRGFWYPPHLAKRFLSGGKIPEEFLTPQEVSIDKQYFEMVVEGMAQCVNRGTARSCAIPDIQVCGKTGTSQNPHGDDHSVFFAFAPKDKPKIAIAVYVENATWGATYAAPIASLMIEKYLNDSIAPSRKHMEERMFNANLTDKYLENIRRAAAKVEKAKPAPELPSPDVPTDEPPAKSPATTSIDTRPRTRR
ncbi:MAG: penicillin-binding protein 2 [Lewinellaceae bacterium]|nr:penicillin-binding protein 2 [Saprospiraceae bacterium]MCB9333810.1 penicillin-binding protein 2 [Lewinellaceae bacterium]